MTITAPDAPTTTSPSPEPTETYLPADVVAALCLLAVPGSLLAGAPTSTTSESVQSPSPQAPAESRVGSCRGSRRTASRGTLPRDFAPRTWELIPRELTEAGIAVLVDELAGRAPRQEARETVAAEELAVIEATERVHAWLDLVALGAIRRFREAVGHEVELRAGRVVMAGGKPYDEKAEADAVAEDELALVTGHTMTETRRRLRLACLDDGRATVVLARLAEGRTTLDRASRILDATVDLDPETVRIISDRVLAPMPDGTLAPHRVFIRRLHRQVVLHQPDRRTRHAEALRRRTAFGELHDDGTGTLTVVGDGPRVTAALDRVDDIARSLRASGDQRPLDALRSDVTLDLLLVGWPVAPPAGRPAPDAKADAEADAAHGKPSSSGAATETAADGDGAEVDGPSTDSVATAESPVATGSRAGRNQTAGARPGPSTPTPDEPPRSAPSSPQPTTGDLTTDLTTDPTGDPAGDPDGDPTGDPTGALTTGALTTGGTGTPTASELVDLGPWWRVAVAPPAVVHVVVSLTSLLGLEEGTAELPGHGFVTAEVARQVALSEGSVWRRLVTDPLTGTALDLSTKRYRPTPAMVDSVAALDGHCRAPGCTVPAERCDLDHLTPWPRGETSVRNLRATHRRHHNHKTRGTWRSTAPTDAGPEGRSRWRTVGGRDYVTERYRYDDPTHHEAGDDERARVADIEPPPF